MVINKRVKRISFASFAALRERPFASSFRSGLSGLGIIAGIVLLFLLLPAASRAADGKIAVLISANDAPFKEAVTGFNDFLARHGHKTAYEVFQLDNDAGKAGPAVQKIKSGGARLVFTVGSLATDAAVKGISDIPIVACLVLRTDLLKRSANATGVGLEFPVETQIEWMQRMLPRARSVGIVYNAAENQAKVDVAVEAARKAGLRIEAELVRSPQDVPAALNNLSRRVDILWGIPDSVMLSPLIAKNVLLFSLRNSIPFVGPSAAWVKAGALYSLDWDYADLGVQCGEMAVRVLEGAQPASIPAAAPRKVQYTINLYTAKQMKLSLSDQLLSGARQTY
jgi:putative ABC transport system substrate-binding protein